MCNKGVSLYMHLSVYTHVRLRAYTHKSLTSDADFSNLIFQIWMLHVFTDLYTLCTWATKKYLRPDLLEQFFTACFVIDQFWLKPIDSIENVLTAKSNQRKVDNSIWLLSVWRIKQTFRSFNHISKWTIMAALHASIKDLFLFSIDFSWQK